MDHNFEDRLHGSHAYGEAPWWKEIYDQAFPRMVSMEELSFDQSAQEHGVDRKIILDDGHSYNIDEKVRTVDYGDFLAEIWSVYPYEGEPPYRRIPGRSVEGWVPNPKHCDYVAYAVVPTGTCTLLPSAGLEAAWTQHGARWRTLASKREQGFGWIRATTEGRYATISISMPWSEIHSAIADALTIHWHG
jgi:hypothetical protein